MSVTRDEAVAEAERLGREHPDREAAAWFPKQEACGDWVLMKVPRPAPRKQGELRTGTDQSPRPDPSQDVMQEPRPWLGTG